MNKYKKHDEIKKGLPWLIPGILLAIICLLYSVNIGGSNYPIKIGCILSLILIGKGMSYDPTHIHLWETPEDWKKRNKEKWGENWGEN